MWCKALILFSDFNFFFGIRCEESLLLFFDETRLNPHAFIFASKVTTKKTEGGMGGREDEKKKEKRLRLHGWVCKCV